MELTGEKRRDKILNDITTTDGPVTASSLAKKYSVSRQIIVGDVAILRASGHDIIATPRGYIYNESPEQSFPCIELVACKHDAAGMRDELYTIVDFGATVIDVCVEHPIYGELIGSLNLSSRFDVDMFMDKFDNNTDAAPISALTGGTHLHHIGAKSSEVINRIKEALNSKGLLVSQ